MELCPRCFQDDEVIPRRLPDGAIEYVCSGTHQGSGPHTWRGSSDPAAGEMATEGITDELLEPLLACVVPGEPFAEYGVVEYRFRQQYPQLFRAHVRERGHVLTGKRLDTTASAVRFAMALSRQERSGLLLKRFGPATGAWAYNQRISYWARPPRPSGKSLTWVAYCSQFGRPADWTDDDRAACAGLT